MKIAVIGGGTAGCMAAAHITKYFPDFELYHIYASSIPTIGVGEGTQTAFPEWLYKITGLNFSALQERCKVTRKFGIQFENWGVKNKHFLHNFYPIQSSYGYHISAAKMVELLQEYVSATRIDKKITGVESDSVKVNLTFEDKTQIEVDLAFDASGFPTVLNDREHTKISLIPTNAALIRRSSVVEFQSATRSIARPFGWIFVIPLTTHTSYGYVYNSSINSKSEIETDLYNFFWEEKVIPSEEEKSLTFPNFISHSFFDGSVCKLGNAGSFIEPLEAATLTILLTQIYYASNYILRDLSETDYRRGKLDEDKIKNFNKNCFNFVLKVALFVGWHYASGSCFDTEFWHFAKSNFEKEIKKLENQELLGDFKKYLQAGSKLNSWQFLTNGGFIKSTFGGFPVASFFEVGHGIGYF